MAADTYSTSVEDVALVIPARARSAGGDTLYTFVDPDDEAGDPGTTPPAEVVELLIQTSADRVYAAVGEVPDALQGDAKAVIALRTAMSIERGADDFNEARYRALNEDYKTALADLLAAVADVEAGGEAGDTGDGVMPVGSFPPAFGEACAAPGAELPYGYWPCG